MKKLMITAFLLMGLSQAGLAMQGPVSISGHTVGGRMASQEIVLQGHHAIASADIQGVATRNVIVCNNQSEALVPVLIRGTFHQASLICRTYQIGIAANRHSVIVWVTPNFINENDEQVVAEIPQEDNRPAIVIVAQRLTQDMTFEQALYAPQALLADEEENDDAPMNMDDDNAYNIVGLAPGVIDVRDLDGDVVMINGDNHYNNQFVYDDDDDAIMLD